MLLMRVRDVADRDHDVCCRARGYDNSECVQYDACYGAFGWVAAEEVRTSLNKDICLARCVSAEFNSVSERDGMSSIVGISRDGVAKMQVRCDLTFTHQD